MKFKKLLPVLLALTCTFQAGAVQLPVYAADSVLVESGSGEYIYEGLKYTKERGKAETDSDGKIIFSYSLIVSGVEEGAEYLVIPEEIDGMPVTKISSMAFQNCTSLKEVVIPDSIDSSNGFVFTGCSALESVTLPRNMKNISAAMFRDCTSLKSIVIPESVETIGEDAFRNCTSLAEIQISSGVSDFGQNAFQGTAWLENQPDGAVCLNHILYCHKGTIPGTEFVIPDDVTCIAPFAFQDQENLESVVIPQGVETIGANAFSGCTKLKTIQFPGSLRSVNLSAFSDTLWYEEQPDGVICAGNYALTCKGELPEESVITVPDGTTILAPRLFMDHTELKEVILPDGLTTIYGCVFAGCTNLETIRIPDSVVVVGYEVFEDTAWYAQQPDGLLYVGSTAYCYKGKMPEQTEITFREGTLSVAPGAFQKCNAQDLVAVTFPDGLQEIGNGAFSLCGNLKEVIVPESVQRIGSDYAGGKNALGVSSGSNLIITVLNPSCVFLSKYAFPMRPVIRGYENSTAQAYAEENGFIFESLGASDQPEEKKIRTGDIDMDNEITILDVVMGNRVFVGVENVTLEQQKAYDVNHSGSVDLADSMLVLQYLVHLIDDLDHIID